MNTWNTGYFSPQGYETWPEALFRFIGITAIWVRFKMKVGTPWNYRIYKLKERIKRFNFELSWRKKKTGFYYESKDKVIVLLRKFLKVVSSDSFLHIRLP